MATKPILGDDPFAEPSDKKALSPAPTAPSDAAAVPRRVAKKRPSETDPPEVATALPANEAATAASNPPSPPPNPPAASAEEHPPSEYGPSIDRAPTSPSRPGIAQEVWQAGKSVRDRLLPNQSAEAGLAGQSPRTALPLEFIWKRWRELAMRDRSDVVDEFGRDPEVARKIEPLLEFLYRTYFRVDVRGVGHIPEEGRALIVANHSGTLPYDGAMIMHAVRQEEPHRAVRPLVEDFVFHFPYLGTLMNRIGGVRACPENAERLLNEDQLVAVFPEGIKGIGKLYSERYQLQRFGRGGFIKLALKCDAPIVPTAVVGAEEIHPMLSKVTWLAKSVGIPYLPITPTFPWLGPLGLLPMPSKWFIAFGEPMYFNAEYGAEGANDRILVNKLAEEVRRRIQSMIDELLKTRKSVLFG